MQKLRDVRPSDKLATVPFGTLAPAIMGGAWCRVEDGWQWNGHLPSGAGGVYPRPGGDWDGRLIYPRVTEAEIETGKPARCEGCGAQYSLADLKLRSPLALSCCPERRMVAA